MFKSTFHVERELTTDVIRNSRSDLNRIRNPYRKYIMKLLQVPELTIQIPKHSSVYNLIDDNDRSKILDWACNIGDIRMVQRLLPYALDRKTNVETTINDLFHYACWYNYLTLAKNLLPFVDPNLENSYGLRAACYNGQVDIDEFLLEDGRLDPTTLSLNALRVARNNGHWSVVWAFLLDSRVDQQTGPHRAIFMAIENGQSELVSQITTNPMLYTSVMEAVGESQNG